MRNFILDERLAHDCIRLGELDLSLLLLMNNALVPWFILVPRVAQQELYLLPRAQQAILLDEIDLISRLVQDEFAPHKLNVAAIGNVVRQLHVHIVARRTDDFCWPGVVWGAAQRVEYTAMQLEGLRSRLENRLGERLRGI